MKKFMTLWVVLSTFVFIWTQVQAEEAALNFKHKSAHSHSHSDSSSDNEEAPPFVSPLNNYRLLLIIGQDEFLPSSALNVTLDGFTALGWNAGTIETFRQSAISWFNTRFGVDFSAGLYDPTTGITTISYATMIPVSFGGNYRVLASNYEKIPATPVYAPPHVTADEFVVIFNSAAAGKFYTGTFANAGPVAIDPTDTLDFGIYRIYVTKKHNKVKRTYDFYSRVFYPNKSQPINAYPGRVNETFQLFSPDFGPGARIFECSDS